MTHLGKSVPHDSAALHVTGEAQYIDDLPRFANELQIEVVPSPIARGRLLGIDATAALALPGVVCVLTAADIPGHNRFGAIFCDEPFLADEDVAYVGQPVAVVAAETAEIARRARALVKVSIADEEPSFTIDSAIMRGEYIGPERLIARGDFASAWESAPHHLEGIFHVAGQEQFYFESQACIAVPGEYGQVTVHSSTQNPTEVQHVVAEALGLSMHQVICQCRRMGGGFGGKETQASIPAVLTALVAVKTGRAARVVYTKDDDMKMTGKRHQYKARYRIGFDEEGRILAAHLQFNSNGGAYADLSTSILERTMLHAENAYWIPNIEIVAQACRTNLPPNTAFRGFGGPQGVATIENAIQEIALKLGRDALDIRRVNCYGTDERNVTPYGQIIRHNTLPRVFDDLERTSDYRARMAAVEEFNAGSRTLLRGLAFTPVKFGIAFTASFLNQGNAVVNIYWDGTVQLSTGATEMGQGVHTKMRQIAAERFGIPLDRVIVTTTSTEKNINTSPTAASASTDLNGMAVEDACRQLRARLADFAAEHFTDLGVGLRKAPEHVIFANGEVYDERLPEKRMTFGQLTRLCRVARIDLGARGFFATPGVDFNRDTGRGNPFFYYTIGGAVSEVLLDRLTGEFRVERVDVLIDLGRTINPQIDRGQTIGGFVQGQGWATTEELVYNARGELLSHSPTTYKIPGIDDVAPVFNLDFLDNDTTRQNVFSSKAVGEPPLLLGISVWAAVKHALSFVAPGELPPLKLPATGEEVLRCVTELEKKNVATREHAAIK